jgi:L-amino acid N-acyltransferase YncA
MSTSNSSDKVLRPPVGGFRKDKALPQQSTQTERSLAAQPLPSSNLIDFESSSEGTYPSHNEHEDWQKGVTIPKENRRDYLLGEEELKENRRGYLIGADEDVREELVRLQKEALVKAHRGGQGNSEETASPELLAACRDGPGTDILSPIYQHLEKVRLVPRDDTPDYSNLPGTSYVFSTEEFDTEKDPKALQAELETQVEVWRELYTKTPRTYPSVSDKKVTLSPAADDRHKRALTRFRRSLAKIKDLNSSSKSETKVIKRSKQIVQEHAWSDRYIANWEYCPPGISDAKWYRARIQSWLDDTIPRECYVDIFHEAFFQGTAHPDGETSMFILDMRKYKSIIHPSDKQALNHAHESAAGYVYNIIAQNEKAQEEEHRRKEMDTKVRKDALNSPRLRSPSSPVANIYLRPAEGKDAQGLEEIINWYAKHSSRSPNTNIKTNIDSEQVLQRIRGCREAQLPFIVAVDRHRSSSKRPENILGYALAKEFANDAYSCHYTAELELFVKDGETNQGIGKCLLDRLLQACDPSHDSKGGYQFHASTNDRSAYYPGGRRRLARLVFTLSYIGNDNREIAEHNRVKKWLEEHAGFEEQGLLWGVRVWGTKL